MPELNLEALAERLTALEMQMATLRVGGTTPRDWRTVVGISEETDFSRLMQAEMAAARDKERRDLECESLP